MEYYRELPSWKCHKEVWAIKIKEVQRDAEFGGTAVIVPDEPGFGPFPVGHDYLAKHKPKAGGYYVQYKDGYESFSPADAFEGGYTRLT